MIAKLVLEGLLLGVLLIIFCCCGLRNGAVGMVFLYDKAVQERATTLGLTTPETIRKRQRIFRGVGIVTYIAYVLLCAYAVNDARGFLAGFLPIFGILSVLNLVDRFLVDEWWVGHTTAWIIPGTEEFMPYIRRRDKCQKWLFGTVGFACISAILAGIMTRILH